MMFARFGVISYLKIEKRSVVLQPSEARNLYTMECLMLAAFRNQKLSLTQYAQHTGAKFGAWHGVCSIV